MSQKANSSASAIPTRWAVRTATLEPRELAIVLHPFSVITKKYVPAEETPEFVKWASSGEIQIGVRKGDVPSAEQGAELKKDLHEALATQDAIANLSNAEKDLMTQAAQASLRTRKQKGSR